MNKFLVLITIFTLTLFSKSSIVSDIPLPKTYIFDLSPYQCNESCMRDLVDNGNILMFLAFATHQLEDRELENIRMASNSLLNRSGTYYTGATFNIALLLPNKKIGKYAASTTNSVFAYLLTKETPFSLQTFIIEDESIESIQTALYQIQESGFHYVIAPLTAEGVESLIEIDPSLMVYIPTINKKETLSSSYNLYFGGIDYFAQSDLLLSKAVSPLVIFSGESSTGQKLAHYQKKEFLESTDTTIETSETTPFYETMHYNAYDQQEEIPYVEPNKVYPYTISKNTTNLSRYLKDNEDTNSSSVMVNTPIIKTNMIVSQLTLYDANETNILSTQINYNPLLLSMTQYRDRDNMLIANSITKKDDTAIDTNLLIGNDIEYDWINYSASVGVDYFYSQTTGEARTYNFDIRDQQVIYDIELLQPMRTKFKKVKTDLESEPLSQGQFF